MAPRASVNHKNIKNHKNRDKNPSKNPKNRKNRANKIHLVFDETKRREFLTGFHKRKLQRKKEGREKFERELKEERKRLKTEAKESYKKLVTSRRPIPELETLLQEEYNDGDATVKVIELSTNPVPTEIHINAKDEKAEEETEEELPGMSLDARHNFTSKKDVKRLLKKEATKKLQKSKVFQLKNKMEKKKQLKQSQRAKNEKTKALQRKTKKRHK